MPRQIAHDPEHAEKDAPERPPPNPVRNQLVLHRTLTADKMEHVSEDRKIHPPCDGVGELFSSGVIKRTEHPGEKTSEE